jgi:spermidine synthase
MSDTFDEIKDHYDFIRKADGNVIIAGLGLGMVANAILDKPDVTQVTVVDLSPDVIKLVGPHWQKKHGDRLKIIQADILQWKPNPGDRWDHAWWDIWDDKCGDNLVQMTKIKRKFAQKVGTQACWGESHIRYWSRRDKRQRRSIWGS